jgi:hypothetical protein
MSLPAPEEQILGYGDEAIDRPLDAILDDSAAADPMKKGNKKPKTKCNPRIKGKTIIIIASGFKYPKKSDEIFAIEKDSWMPTSKDFRVMGSAHGGSVLEASNAKDFFEHIGNQSKGSVKRVVFVGHGGVAGLGFSGTLLPITQFSAELTSSNIGDYSVIINNKVKPALHRNAQIILIACYAGSTNLMDALANTLKRCIIGFQGPIEVENPSVSDSGNITKRGFTRVGEKQKDYKKGWNHLLSYSYYVEP